MRWPLRRRPSGHDPYEFAAARIEGTRQRREETGDAVPEPPPGVPVPPFQRPGGRWLWAFLAIVVVAGLRPPEVWVGRLFNLGHGSLIV